ncbi:MAG: calcium/sodium antiporter [Phycisphaerales bacterium]|nr:calcium/sodium antiporter [Phycisphaerales bacterium]
MDALTFLGGLALLLVGGRLLVSASVETATRLGVPPLLVGLTLVAWGTSAPELALNLIASAKGNAELTLGNVVGANICNMGVVLGLCAILRPLPVASGVVRTEIPLMIAMFGLVALAVLSPLAGVAAGRAGPVLMIAAFAAYSVFTIRAGLSADRRADPLAEQTGGSEMARRHRAAWMLGAMFLGGLVLLGLGGNLAADAAAGIARRLGMSDRVVGLTVVALGTTLPELVTGLVAVLNRQTDLAVGNAVGSCLFNVGAVYGLSGLLAPPGLRPEAALSVGVMVVLGLLLVPMSRTFSGRIARIEGVVLVAIQGAFIALEVWRGRG